MHQTHGALALILPEEKLYIVYLLGMKQPDNSQI